MIFYSTAEVAKKVGVSLITLKRYIAARKIPLPPKRAAGVRVRLWTEAEVDNVRQLLPKIANGRKTRYKKQSAVSKQQSERAKQRKPKKK